MDTSSESAARASLLKMTSGMSQKEREDFNDAIYGIIKFAKDEMSKPNGAMTREEASAMLEGKTAKEIIELHKSLARKKASSALYSLNGAFTRAGAPIRARPPRTFRASRA